MRLRMDSVFWAPFPLLSELPKDPLALFCRDRRDGCCGNGNFLNLGGPRLMGPFLDRLYHWGNVLEGARRRFQEWLTFTLADCRMFHVDSNDACRLSGVGGTIRRYHERTTLNQHGYVLARPLSIFDKQILALFEPK